MSNEKMAYDLFKFLQKGVTVESLQESTNKAYSKVNEEHVGFKRLEKKIEAEGKPEAEAKAITASIGQKKYGKAKFQKMAAKEGILVKDPSEIDDPEGTILTLAEDVTKTSMKEPVGENPEIKTADAGITEQPEITKIQKEMGKDNVDVAKVTQGKDGKDPDAKATLGKEKEVKKIEPKISTVETVKTPNPGPDGTAVKESGIDKVPVINKAEQADSKKPLEVSGMEPQKAENASEGILVADPSTIDKPEDQIQTLAEERILTTVSDENVANDLKSKYPGSRAVMDEVNGKKQWIIMVKDSINVKEEVSVAVTTDDKKVDIATTPEGTVTTTVTGAGTAPAEMTPVVPEMEPVVPTENTPAEVSDEDMLMAEKIYVVDLLKSKSSLTEKEQAFIKAVESVVLSEARKMKVADKMKALRAKKGKK